MHISAEHLEGYSSILYSKNILLEQGSTKSSVKEQIVNVFVFEVQEAKSKILHKYLHTKRENIHKCDKIQNIIMSTIFCKTSLLMRKIEFFWGR